VALAVVVGIAVLAVGSGASASRSASVRSNALAQLYPPAGSDWAASEGSSSNLRYSSLSQINASNAGKLKVAWTTSLYPSANFATLGVESTPIEKGGVMFVPTTDGVSALNATTGAAIWTYHGLPNVKGSLANLLAARTLSTGDGLVFAGQTDGSVVALDASNGDLKWTAQVASVGTYPKKSQPISIPFTVFANGVVLAGINGGDSPLRGHIDAYDAKDGKLIWRFFTLPDVNNPAIKTWSNPAEAATGGASIWSIPAVDTALNRVYVGTGNAYPYTGRAPGESLYANSEVALDLKTGQLKWFYQAVHHDEWDYDCPTPPVLYNAPVGGATVKAIAFSCKSGYVYILNRATGKPIFPIPEVKIPDLDNGVGAKLNHTWPTQPEPTGGEAEILPHCPTAAQVQDVLPGYPKAPNGTPYVLTCPYTPTNHTHYTVWGPYFAFGGTDYPPMSYDPQTNDLYVCANVTYQSMENTTPKSEATSYLTGGGWTAHGESGTVSALNVSSNKLDWQTKYQASDNGACYSGVLSTAGGLIFTSSRGQAGGVPHPFGGTLYAYNAKTGKPVWHYRNSSIIEAPAITYMANGKQYVAVDMTSGTSNVNIPGFGTFTTSTRDKLTVFSLG
jgi:quinohemoprotein ethanol dehydrogenase